MCAMEIMELMEQVADACAGSCARHNCNSEIVMSTSILQYFCIYIHVVTYR